MSAVSVPGCTPILRLYAQQVRLRSLGRWDQSPGKEVCGRLRFGGLARNTMPFSATNSHGTQSAGVLVYPCFRCLFDRHALMMAAKAPIGPFAERLVVREGRYGLAGAVAAGRQRRGTLRALPGPGNHSPVGCRPGITLRCHGKVGLSKCSPNQFPINAHRSRHVGGARQLCFHRLAFRQPADRASASLQNHRSPLLEVLSVSL